MGKNQNNIYKLANALHVFNNNPRVTFGDLISEDESPFNRSYPFLIILEEMIFKYTYLDLKRRYRDFQFSIDVRPLLFGKEKELNLYTQHWDIIVRSIAKWKLQSLAPLKTVGQSERILVL